MSARARFTALSRAALSAVVVGCGDSTAPTIGPPAIVSFDAMAASSSAITLTWRVDRDGATGFEIVRSADPPSSFGSLTTVAGTTRSFTDAALRARSGHCYKLRALRESEHDVVYSAYSSPVCATTNGPSSPPLSPTNLDAESVDSLAIAVRWKDEAGDNAGFRVERAGSADGPWTAIAEPGPNELQVADFGEPSEHRYCYHVIAYNDIGASAPSNVDCVVPPAAPTSLAAAFQSGPAVVLTWTQHSSSATGYRIARAVNQGLMEPVATTNATGTYVDERVENGKVYTYLVRAISADGSSGTSNVAAIALGLTPPAAVQNVVATGGSHAVSITWDDTQADESGSRIERSIDGGITWAPAAVSLAGYPYAVDGDGSIITPEHRYCYRVVQFNSAGDGAPSDAACARTIAAPTELRVQALGSDSLTFSWTDNSQLESGYRLMVASFVGESVVAEFGPNVTTAHVAAEPVLTNEQNDLYVVAFIRCANAGLLANDCATSDASNAVHVGATSKRP